MNKRYFGTDGIRGRAGDTLTPELALRAAYGFAVQIRQRTNGNGKRPLVVLGQDPRLSSPMLAAAVEAGLNLGQCDVMHLGIVPTPVVPLILQRHHAVGGVMITASHNPVADNGIKFFGSDGFKLDPQLESAIEQVIDAGGPLRAPEAIHFGSNVHVDATAEYLGFLAKAIRPAAQAAGIKLVLDCAHGATCAYAPRAFEHAGYTVQTIHGTPDGARINVKCGATELGDLSREVRRSKAHLGLAFDGDGDRMLAVDENGKPVNGDKIIALLATKVRRYRAQHAVVMTHMTNIGVEEALNAQHVGMYRTEVGDIKVLEAMQANDLLLGGEQSGHIIMLDKSRAGDGILAGLQLCAVVAAAGEPLSALVEQFPEYPQRLTNLAVQDKSAWQKNTQLMRKLATTQAQYPGVRFYLRPSGTENVLRVLTEARDAKLCAASNEAVCNLLISWDGTAR